MPAPAWCPTSYQCRPSLIGRVVAYDITFIRIIILKIGQKLRLLHKHRLPGLPCVIRSIFQRTCRSKEGGNFRSGLIRSWPYWFICEHFLIEPFAAFLSRFWSINVPSFRPYVCYNHTPLHWHSQGNTWWKCGGGYLDVIVIADRTSILIIVSAKQRVWSGLYHTTFLLSITQDKIIADFGGETFSINSVRMDMTS